MKTYFSGTPEFLRLSSANCLGTGILSVLRKFSSTDSRLTSGSGEMHVNRVADVAKLFADGIGSGDVHGLVSDDDVGIKRARNDILRKFPSLLFLASTCSITFKITRFRLFARQWTASFSDRFIIRLVLSFVLILSFSDFPKEKRRLRGSLLSLSND